MMNRVLNSHDLSMVSHIFASRHQRLDRSDGTGPCSLLCSCITLSRGSLSLIDNHTKQVSNPLVPHQCFTCRPKSNWVLLLGSKIQDSLRSPQGYTWRRLHRLWGRQWAARSARLGQQCSLPPLRRWGNLLWSVKAEIHQLNSDSILGVLGEFRRVYRKEVWSVLVRDYWGEDEMYRTDKSS